MTPLLKPYLISYPLINHYIEDSLKLFSPKITITMTRRQPKRASLRALWQTSTNRGSWWSKGARMWTWWPTGTSKWSWQLKGASKLTWWPKGTNLRSKELSIYLSGCQSTSETQWDMDTQQVNEKVSEQDVHPPASDWFSGEMWGWQLSKWLGP